MGFLACAALIRWTDLDLLIYILLALSAVLFLYTEARIIGGMSGRNMPECQYIIVLGAHVEGKRITDSLKRRLDRAFEYLNAHPEPGPFFQAEGEREKISQRRRRCRAI